MLKTNKKKKKADTRKNSDIGLHSQFGLRQFTFGL